VNIRDQIPLLETLSEIDERVRVVDDELKLRRGGLAALRDEVAALSASIDGSRQSITTMEKTRNELQIELRQMQTQVEKSREKMSRSRNERESVAAQREQEELRRLVRDREDEVQKLEGLCERAKASVAESEQRRTALTRELEGDAEVPRPTRGRAGRARRPARHGSEGAPAGALPTLRVDPIAPPEGDRKHLRRHLQRVSHRGPPDDVPKDDAARGVRAVSELPQAALLRHEASADERAPDLIRA
jgi:hypothetical protein